MIWSLVSLSYFISAKSQLNPAKSYTFNVSLAGLIEIASYLTAIVTSINFGRIYVIKRLLIISGITHLCFYFIQPHDHHTGISKAVIFLLDILVRVLMSFGNTFLAIYSI